LQPFFITSVASYDHAAIRISGHSAGKSIFFYIEKKPLEYSIEHLNSGNVVALIDNQNNSRKMHFLSETGSPIKTATYQFSTEIHKPKNNTAAVPAKPKKIKKNSLQKATSAQQQKPKPIIPKETTLLLALKKALKGKEQY
jgi:hypothetical protein